MPKYGKKPHVNIKVRAQVAGERLELIRVKHAGRLTAEMVVLDAKPKQSPLHDAFQWDDTKAAAAHRLWQASYLIRSITVIVEKSPTNRPVRAFVHFERPSGESHYKSVVEVMSSADLRAEMLNRALKEAEEWQQRYKDLDELAGVFAAIKAAKKPVEQKKDKTGKNSRKRRVA